MVYGGVQCQEGWSIEGYKKGSVKRGCLWRGIRVQGQEGLSMEGYKKGTVSRGVVYGGV